MNRLSQKQAGAYYTPDRVVSSLVRWAVRDRSDRLLDPSCGDGRFIASHRNSVGVEQDTEAAALANPSPGDRPVRQIAPNDIALTDSRGPVESIVRFHSALGALTGRNGIREDASRYEAISLALIDTRDGAVGRPLSEFPPPDSPLRLEHFFETLYGRYDERYVYSAPDLKSRTRRLEWSPDSPALESEICNRPEYEIMHSNGPSAI